MGEVAIGDRASNFKHKLLLTMMGGRQRADAGGETLLLNRIGLKVHKAHIVAFTCSLGLGFCLFICVVLYPCHQLKYQLPEGRSLSVFSSIQ